MYSEEGRSPPCCSKINKKMMRRGEFENHQI
jgi:hypothetical protein